MYGESVLSAGEGCTQYPGVTINGRQGGGTPHGGRCAGRLGTDDGIRQTCLSWNRAGHAEPSRGQQRTEALILDSLVIGS